MDGAAHSQPEISIEAMRGELPSETESRLREGLAACPDVAFAHLVRVELANEGTGSQPSLFVWLVPEAVGSLRAALNLVSETVARALPEELFLDVLILNSVPELVSRVEEAGGLLVVRDPDERRRAQEAAQAGGKPEAPARRRWFR
ncbi:MAG: hypothetical protein V2I67_18055 [Thermoanaerobaculales bacterium]|jgi:hypothetical protein|nr:hypothetical protein [Thermoanaerobaculales bacterium]